MKIAAKSLLVLGLIGIVCAPGAFAGEWQAKHPRRAQVNRRLRRQNRRITQGVQSGTLTKEEAQELRAGDRSVRKEERTMAAANGGHITKAEQAALNQQENQLSRQIYQEKHDGQ